jgi:DNA ligase-1
MGGKSMAYSELVDIYEALSGTTKRLEKEKILAEFLRKLEKKGEPEWVYLLRGKVVPDYDSRVIGISRKLTAKAIGKGLGVSQEKIEEKFRKVGDFGEIAEEFAKKKGQENLFNKKLEVGKVFENLRKLMEIEGKGSVDKKMALVSELLGQAKGKEAKYVVRTLLEDLRIGVADGVLRDAIAEAFFEKEKKEMSEKVEQAYDMAGDFAVVVEAAVKGKKALEKVGLVLGRPINVMLPVKVNDVKDAFRIVGKPAAIEHKYDGFRMLVNRNGKEIKLFTRRLDDVTSQFPDVVKSIRENVKGDKFMLDCEVVGYDPKTKKSKPFEAISQRIKRKYDIDKLIEKLPVEINVFDVLMHGGKALMEEPFEKRRNVLEKVVPEKKFVIRPAKQIVTGDEKEVEKFYKEALKSKEEGVMFKKLDAPYRQGRRVGYIVKLKPVANDLDLVVVGAEYGSGKRAGGLTSYYVACRKNGEFLEVGKVSSGLKEKESEEGTTYKEMSKLLEPLITETKGNKVKVKPKIVVAVTYQNVQKSPSYGSGWALRFPRITAYRPDRSLKDIASLGEIEKESKKHKGGGEGLRGLG